jgi:plasmid stability protein
VKSGNSVKYTIRNIPVRVARALRQKSKQSGKSLNAVALDALAKGLGLSEKRPVYHDLDGLAGTWVEDPAFDAAIAAQDQVEPQLWK